MRRRQAEKRTLMPDPKFNDEMVAYFVNCVMKCGKKSIAENIVYTAFELLLEKAKNQKDIQLSDEDEGEGGKSGGSTDSELMLRAFKKALNNVSPMVELKSRRVGGATYQIPMEVPPARRIALGIRWLLDAARKRSEKGMYRRLAGELLDALLNRGEAVKKREDTYRMAKANQAFAHFRWN